MYAIIPLNRGYFVMEKIKEEAISARKAARKLAVMSEPEKNRILFAMADALLEKEAEIICANKIDVENAKAKGKPKAMLDRLSLDSKRIADMANGIRKVAELPDPVGAVIDTVKRPNGLMIGKKRVPLGVIGIIYEARPNVTSDAAALCLKAGNAVILRGGSEAINSNMAVVSAIASAAENAGMPKGAVSIVENTSRDAATYMMGLNGYIDVLIPRGGAGLIRSVVENAKVPVIETGTGNCHIFVDESADIEMAKNITVNAKTQRPAVCNAAESLLIHEAIADKAIPVICGALKEAGVEIRGCEKTACYIDCKIATDEDYAREFLDYIISVKVVKDIDEAIEHIAKYSTKHSEAIVTKSYDNAKRFQNEVDSAAVYVNASTRFTDGFEFGFGAEIGISTQKLHARGPMGLNELTTIKYIIDGDGQIRG